MKAHLDKTFDTKLINKYDLNLNISHDVFVANVSKTKSKTHIAIAEKSFANKFLLKKILGQKMFGSKRKEKGIVFSWWKKREN